MAQEPSAKDQTAVDAAKTAKEAETRGAGRPAAGGSGAEKPRGSGDSPKPHGDPLKPVLEE